MSNSFEKASPMSDKLLQDMLDSNNRLRLEQREQVAAAKQAAPDKEIFDITHLEEFYSRKSSKNTKRNIISNIRK
jgi:hypothetical protein